MMARRAQNPGMRRADRLFSIIQILRRRRLATASRLSSELEVSERTIYRDIADLVASGVPIDGEAGVGYILREGHDLPPLMFTPAEIEALVLGARIVSKWSDEELARNAADAVAKIAAVLPDRLRDEIGQIALYAPESHSRMPLPREFADLRAALRDHRKVAFAYTNVLDGQVTNRTVRPLAFLFYGAVWLMLAWCELRQDFRSFRLDRMSDLDIPEPFQAERGKTLPDYIRQSDGRGGLQVWLS